jgi:uncharacterized membrane-anchored protein YhcB (DUF1043 family)
MKAKPVILVIITLIIGFVIGMLTSAQIRLHRMRPVRFYLSREEFREGFYKSIEADEKQKVEFEKIFNEYEELNNNLLNNYRKGFEQNIKEMQKKLESILTKEQQDKLKEIDKRREEMFREARKNFSNDSLNRRRFDRRRDPDMGPSQPGRRAFPGDRPSGDNRQFPDGRPMYPPPPGTYPDRDSIAADPVR